MAIDAETRRQVAVKVVDTDVHPAGSLVELIDYIAEPWRTRYYKAYADELEIAPNLFYPERVAGAQMRRDAFPPGGGFPGSDPRFLEKQLFQEGGVDLAVLLFTLPWTKFYNPSFDSAICAAHNEWMVDTWLTKYNSHGRYRGAIRVSPYEPEVAAREIERWAGHPGVVQVYIFPEGSATYGQPQFDPIWRAASRAKMPIGMHVKRQPGMRLLTPVGFPSYHIEVYAGSPIDYMSQLTSLVFEGAFERFPNLKVACIEGGFAWMAPFLWRLDNQWRALGSEVPQVKRPPSEYMRERVKLSTQPFEEPESREDLLRVIEWMGPEMLMFSTDYPHYDTDNPDWVIKQLAPAYREQVLGRNAIDFYGLPSTRAVDYLDAPEVP
jgi:predicted TIM-barrel fold metal-dependent hydrolase